MPRIVDAKGERLSLRSRPASASLAETAAFTDGEKRTLVFSMAGGTGRSYHAGLSCGNTERRIHDLREPGWRANQAIQGLGRTTRPRPGVVRVHAAGMAFASLVAFAAFMGHRASRRRRRGHGTEDGNGVRHSQPT